MKTGITENANILIIEDQELNVRLLRGMLHRAGYTNVIHTSDAREALPLFKEFHPDILLLDLHMPYYDGFDIMEQLREYTVKEYLPILILTADSDPEMKQRALAHGAMDFINKPFKVAEVLLRVHNLLQVRSLQLQLQDRNEALEATVIQRTLMLEEAQIEILERLTQAAECRDDETGEHTHRVGILAARLGEKLGMSEADVSLLRRAAPLHDVGKIAVPDNILLKAGKLTNAEYSVMKFHSEVGARLLRKSNCDSVRMAETIALTHHEKWDGSGYPCGLKGNDIPLVGRIVALADVFDALTHERPYKNSWSIEEARNEIIEQSGRHFDPEVVEAFLSLQVEESTPVPSPQEPAGDDGHHCRGWLQRVKSESSLQNVRFSMPGEMSQTVAV